MDKYVKMADVLETLRKANIGGYITDRLMEIPIADVQPVKRGRWVFTEKLILGNPYGSYKCSECMYHVPHEDNYCPNCGADMREHETTKG